MGACVSTAQKEEDVDSDEKTEYMLDTTKPRAATLLDVWANKPGFYFESYLARIMYKSFFETLKSKKSDNAKDVVLNFHRVVAYIAGADGLSKSERDILIPTARIWSGYTASEKEIIDAMNEGLTMNTEQAVDFANKLAHTHDMDAGISCVCILYYALTVSGVDGLSDEEKNAFEQVAKGMGLSQNLIDETINTYQMEVEFGDRLSKLLGTAGSK